MGRRRLTVEEKQLRGTLNVTRDHEQMVARSGKVRLTEPIAPPPGMDAAAKREWALHMHLCIQAGTVSQVDVRAFQSLVEAAVLSTRAYYEAMKVGPVAQSDRGSKVAPAWQAWTSAHARYTALLDRFGLTPVSSRHVVQLPVPGGAKLHEVA
jgi:phage terminase small subunit